MRSSIQAAPDVPLFNTAAVVQRTGVPAATLRAWERRYGLPKPHRAASGQRLYSERDIQEITWLHRQGEQGVSISRAVSMVRHGYTSPSALGGHPLPATDAPPSNADDMAVALDTLPDLSSKALDPGRSELPALQRLRRALMRALLDFDAHRAEGVVSEAFGLFGVEDVCLDVIEPALTELGERWGIGEISVAEEHYASAFLRARLFSLMHAYPRDSAGPLVVTACAPHEWHEIGVLMVSLFLVRHGYRVRYLGPNLPVETLVRPLERLRPDLLIFSAHSEAVAAGLEQADRLLQELPLPRPRFAYGGRVFNERPDLRSRIPGIYLGRNAGEALATVQRLLERGSTPPAAPSLR